MRRRRIVTFIASIAAVVLLTVGFGYVKTVYFAIAQARTSLTVSAAISLTESLQEIKQIYTRSKPNTAVTYNFGASGALQQQIEQGAPVDVFFSAAAKQMDALQEKGLLIPETRKTLLTNRIVLITPKNSPALTSFRDLTTSQIKRIAIGEPRSVPAGQYAQEVLNNLGIFEQIKPKIVYANNVRQVLTYVETGNVDAGIVYITDARQSNGVKQGPIAPENLHSPIVYPVAVLKNSKNIPIATDFVQFLSSNPAKAVFEKYGFTRANS